MIIQSRRSFITGLAGLMAAPAIVRASSLMPVRPWAALDGAPRISDLTWIAEYRADGEIIPIRFGSIEIGFIESMQGFKRRLTGFALAPMTRPIMNSHTPFNHQEQRQEQQLSAEGWRVS